MNILYVHETEYINKVVHEYQIIPEILASSGHNVYLIDYPTKWKKNNFWDFGGFKTQYLENIKKANKKKGITLIRPGIIKIPVISRISAFIAYFFIIGDVIKKYKIEKIVLLSAPTNGMQTLYWAKKYRLPILFRLLDVLHQLVPSKLLIWPTYWAEKIIYPQVNEILAITPRLTKYAIKMGGSAKTTSYLPTGADADIFFPAPKDPKILKKYGIEKNDRVILFAGTLYNFSGLDNLIEYYAKHQSKYRNLKFLIVGEGEQFGELKKIVEKNNLEKNIILTGFINYGNLAKIINVADICINPFKINKITNLIFPGKIYQYLICSKPVVATKLQGMTDLYPENRNNNIYYFDINHPEQFYKKLNEINKRKFKNTNPSLQEIAKIIEAKLMALKYN